MALWRVLDLYKRTALRRGQAPAKQTHLSSDKKSTLEPSETGRLPLNRLANRPVVLLSSAKFCVLRLLYLPSVFVCVLFRAVFSLRRPFLLAQKPFFSPSSMTLPLKTSKIHAKPISTHSRFFVLAAYNRLLLDFYNKNLYNNFAEAFRCLLALAR